MKKLLWGICFLMVQQIGLAQSKTTFLITDADGNPVANASIELEKTGVFAANEKGELSFTTRQTGPVRCHISSVGFKSADSTISLPSPLIKFAMTRLALFLEPVEIKALRAGEKAPFAKSNLSKTDIEKRNLGQDLPFILSQTPSVIVTSDAGNGVGYTGLRIRGTDATRINVTVNGIPYNDAESQGTYFVDMPDIASSLNSIQVQRGVGTSSNGAGAFGASINLSTNEMNEKAYAEINNSFGSFNTWKNTVKFGTGLINKHFTFDARLSKISSDGFIDRGSSNLKSLYASAAYTNGSSALRFTIISGTEKTYQAWNGIPQYKLFYNKDSLLNHYYNNLGSLYFTSADSSNLFNSNPRKYNVFTYPNQTDNYQQDHYQLFFNHQFTNDWSVNMAVYLSKGKGYYEEYKNDDKYSSYGLPDIIAGNTTIKKTDLVRRLWLDNNLYGTIFSLLHKTKKDQFSFGGGWNEYDGKHYGDIIWAANGAPNNYQWYYNKAVKKDFNIYSKYQYKLTSHLEALVDLQYRRVDYDIDGTRKFPDLKVDNRFNFFNPKLGLTYSPGSFIAYASYAFANKEPNRDDYENGALTNPPKSEHLQDLELGLEENKFNYGWGINLYYMNYKDQLILTGKINDVGDALRINTPHSYRAGIELQGRYKPDKMVQLSGNFTLSDNKIKNFYDYIPRYNANFDLVQQDTFYYSKTSLAFSPSVVIAGLLQIFPFSNAEINTGIKYAGKQFLDNTGSDAKSINGYFVQDLTLQYG
ncbi:MAG TPA: TonB-dependent receptor plug domain-containing protein, partial [Chitinophagaceae bacterium]|nr:TonB-dependent receptor plug domain-containing protein [Chitinophagaceae bacterium]